MGLTISMHAQPKKRKKGSRIVSRTLWVLLACAVLLGGCGGNTVFLSQVAPNIGEEQLLLLVDGTEYVHYQEIAATPENFIVTASVLHGACEEDDRLRIFATSYAAYYRDDGDTVVQQGASIVPVALTFVRNTQGAYALVNYTSASDGAEFTPSVVNFCKTPVTGRTIVALADQIMNAYGDNETLNALHMQKLADYLAADGRTGVYYKAYDDAQPVLMD